MRNLSFGRASSKACVDAGGNAARSDLAGEVMESESVGKLVRVMRKKLSGLGVEVAAARAASMEKDF
ncbi:hypothetical protein D6817_04095 [Candidatus Pacearchaeota archaeon]|nr:MAG: hypothetical protein D6817_04095 [Candidatus Pacearchaeota archaeon]